MPYTLKDFQPFFKNIDGPVEFYPNDKITASKIVFYDGSVLEGNVIVYINDAKITKKRKRLIYPCNHRMYRTRNEGGEVLVLPGAIIPPAKFAYAAISDSIDLASGYSFGTVVTNRELKREINPVDNLNDTTGVLMFIGKFLTITSRKGIKNGISFPAFAGRGIRVAMQEEDKDKEGKGITLYDNIIKYEGINTQLIKCRIYRPTKENIKTRDAIETGEAICEAVPNCFDPDHDDSGTTITNYNANDKGITITSIAQVDIPLGRTGIDVVNNEYSQFNYTVGKKIWGLTSDGTMNIRYYRGTNTFILNTNGTRFRKDNITMNTKILTFPTIAIPNYFIIYYYNRRRIYIYYINNASIMTAIRNSIVEIDSVMGYINFSKFKTGKKHTLTNFYNFMLADDLISYSNVRYNFSSLIYDSSVNLTIDGNIDINGFITTPSTKYDLIHGSNIKLTNSTILNIGTSYISNATYIGLVNISYIDDYTSIEYVYINGQSCLLKDSDGIPLTITPSDVNLNYVFRNAKAYTEIYRLYYYQ